MTYLAPGDVTPLRYSINGLEPRDEILLKSLIRLLSHRTEHQWVCATEQAQLEVMGKPADPTSSPQPGAAPTPTRLVMAHAEPAQAQHFLRLPLHVNELELKLNQLGRLIAKAPGLLWNAAAPATAPTAPATTYRLQRWPQAALLTSSDRLKLATLLTVRPMSLAALQERSGQSLRACEVFLNDLQNAGILQSPTATSPAPQAPAPAAHQATFQAAPIAVQQHPARPIVVQQRSNVPMGLLARIRQRLALI